MTQNMNGHPPRKRPAQGVRPAQAHRGYASARGKGGSRLPLLLLACVAVLALGFLLQYQFLPDGFTLTSGDGAVEAVAEIHASNTVQINEVMSSNGSLLRDVDGETPDWIEIRNAGSEAVNLRGWSLAKVANAASAFTFPEQMLEPGECLLVYADSVLQNTAGYDYHAPFSLKAAGDTLMLFNAGGTAVDTINIPALKKNTVYRRVDGVWEISDEYTPGMDNTHENYQSMIEVTFETDVVISEVMASNASYAQAEDGQYYDYIELHNTSAGRVDISGWYLSDDREENTKWRVPDGTFIEGGGYLLIYASGLDEGLHAGFRLAREGEEAALSNDMGQLVDVVAYDILQTDQAYSRQADASFTTSLAPTPGMANTNQSAALIESQFAARNTVGVIINEVVASTTQQSSDWAELYNGSGQAVDLSGYGISDDAGKPRKWQFPQGTVIEPGEYLGVFFSGLDGVSNAGALHAGFRISVDGGYGLVLSTPEGVIFDRVPLSEQYTDVAYGRVSGRDGFYYLSTPTPGAANGGEVYQGKAAQAGVSVAGGVQDAPVQVELTAPEGARIYYTLDSSAPDESDALYSGPIEISATTVLRTRVYQDGLLPSYTDTQTYFYGISHDMRVVSLVCDPYDLFDETDGLYMRGPNASASYPYTGANYWRDDELEGHVEMFSLDGTTMISQGCGVRLHGQYSRAERQKAFKIIARNQYSGENRFNARIFSKRPYEQYQSFLLRGSGQDGDKTRMRDSVLQSLAENTSVMYMETELCVVYINGQYWGHYNIRERINKYSICQFEGWEGQEDEIDLVKANSREMQGSNQTYAQMLEYVKEYGIPDDETLARVGEVIDLQNYIEYHALEIFVGNGDTLNVKRYRNANADGKWRYCLFDLDWAFYVDTNSIGRWLAPGGMGTNKYTDNALFIALMKNDTFRDRFLTYMGRMMATDWTTENCLKKFDERYNALQSEMPRHMEFFEFSEKTYASELRRLRNYCNARPAKLLGYFQESMNLSNEQMEHYFGDARRVIEAASG